MNTTAPANRGWRADSLDVDFARYRARAVVLSVLAEIISKIGPATPYTDHDTLALTDKANKELDGFLAACLSEMVQLDLGLVGGRCSPVRGGVCRRKCKTARCSG
jgi:hypothetical protein